MPTWSARSTTAINTAIVLAFFLPPVIASAGENPPAANGIKRLVATVTELACEPVPTLDHVTRQCADDILCASRLLAQSLGPKARLERVRHPDTDTIRRVKTRRSLTVLNTRSPGTLRVRLDHFGRKAIKELQAAISRAAANQNSPISNLEIDLRHNRGGDLDRMLRVASAFIGPHQDALRLTGKNHTTTISIPGTAAKLVFSQIELLVGPNTASSAEIFAALLRVHAHAKIKGARTFGKNYLLRTVPVSHDWRLLVPAQTVSVPGATLEGGLVPDAKH